MPTDEEKDIVEESFELLGKNESDLQPDELATLDALAQRVEEPGLQARIMEQYLGFGRELLGDSLPSNLDPRIAARLEPILGDVGHIRVHSGAMASAAAQAMDARAFAIGDSDIFVDQSQLDPHSPEGGALFAHEVAHTQDAATGFALSSRQRGSAPSDREAFAEAIEMQFLNDELADSVGEAETHAVDRGPQSVSSPPPDVQIDKAKLTERVMEILTEQALRARDRNGA